MKTTEEDRFVYFTTHTSWNSAKMLIDMLEPAEEVRLWDDRTGFHRIPYTSFRVYAKTLLDSEATESLKRSRDIAEIDRQAFENSIDLGLTREAWEMIKCEGDKEKPTLLVMAGLSLPNKLELCRQIIDHASENALFISVEETRKFVCRKMGADEPTYSFEEDVMAEKISLELVRMGLKNGCDVVFDSRNMNETERMGAYAASADGKTEVLVVYVTPVDGDRAYISSLKNNKLKKKLEKKVDVKFYRSKCSKPAITIEPYTDYPDAISQISKSTRIEFSLKKN